MANTHIIKCFVSETQFRKIKLNAEMKGYKSVASYLRNVALINNNYVEDKLAKILYEVRGLKNG